MTRRAMLIGILAVILISITTPYSDLVMQGTWIGLTALPISAVFLLAILVFANEPLRRLGHGLTQAELLIIFCMTLVSAGIPSFGFTGLLIPYMAGPLYFATPENQYHSAIIQHLPAWMLAPSVQAARELYQGLPPGAAIPWLGWLLPLTLWVVLAGAIYLVFFCLCALLHRPWADEEKLTFPLIQLPIEMTRYDGDDSPLPPLLRNPSFWGGFMVPFSIYALNGLNRYYPSVPSINIQLIDLDQYMTGRYAAAVSPLYFRILFSIIGLAYLLPSDVSFGLLFSYLFFLAQQLIITRLGYFSPPFVQAYPVRQFVGQQMIGGILAFGAYLIWKANRSILLEMRKNRTEACSGKKSYKIRQNGCEISSKNPAANERTPMATYKSVSGIVIGLIIIVIWGKYAGAGILNTLIMFLLFFVLQIVATRLVAQAGMLYIQHPYRPIGLMLDSVGTAGIGVDHLPSLTMLDHLWMLDNRSPLMPGVIHGLKAAQAGGIKQRPMTGAMVTAIVLAIPISLASYLFLVYTRGGLRLNPWFMTYYTNNLYAPWTVQLVTQGQTPHPLAYFYMMIGALTMLLLVYLRNVFVWWPVNPVGYLIGASWPIINFWFSILLGWLIKSLTLHYGGARTYRRLLPIALGLILGEFFAAGFWVIVDLCTGMIGHVIFSF